MNILNSKTTSQKVVLAVVVIALVFGFTRALNKSPIGIVQIQGDSMSQALENQNANVFDAIKNFFKNLFSKTSTTTTISGNENLLLSATSDGNTIYSEFSNDVLNLIDPSSNSITYVGEDGVAILEEDAPKVENSYIVRFKSTPLAIRQKELLKTQGVTLKVGTDRNLIKSKLQNVSGDINLQKTKISNEQNKLLNRLNQKYTKDSSKSNTTTSIYKNGNEEIRVQKHDLVLNALSIENVSEAELASLVKGIGDVVAIEPVVRVKASLMDTPDIINSIDLAPFVGPNGAFLTGQGVTIGIIDTGVDYMHQDLGACDFHTSADCKVMGGYDFINQDDDPMDDHGHGTHVSATAGGNGYYTDANGVTHPLPGIAPDVKLYGFKVLGADGSGSSVGVAQGIARCVDPNNDGLIDDHLDVCSMSLGSSGGSPLDSQSLAVDAAVDAGAVFTVAAGNAGPGSDTVGSPGTSMKAITVGAACKPSDIGVDPKCEEGVASFSSRGPVNFTNEFGNADSIVKPDIVSPGVNICAAQFGDWLEGKACLGDGEHIAINGTSMATPTVAGLAALLVQAHPEKTPAEIKQALKFTATNLNLNENTQGSGLVDGIAALSSIGIPSSDIGISGLPLSILDSSVSVIASYTKTPVIKNISDGPLSLSFETVSSNPGVSVSLPAPTTLAPDEEFTASFGVEVDHNTAFTGSYVNELININTGEDIVPLTISRLTPKKLVLDTDSLKFGLFHASQNTYSNTVTLGMTNRMSEQSVTYDVIVDPFIGGVSNNITITPSATQITLGPGESGEISFALSAFASSIDPLPYKNYKTNIRLISSTEEHAVQASLFRGYAMTFDFASETPDFVNLKLDGSGYILQPIANADSMTVFSTKAGPYNAVGNYLTSSGGNVNEISHTFKLDIDLSESTQIPNYNIDKNLANYSIENEFFGSSCMHSFNKPGEGPIASYSVPGYVTVKHNILPEGSSFSLGCHNIVASEKKIQQSQIYITENINQNYVLNSATSSNSVRYVYGFNHKNPGSLMGAGTFLCNWRNFNSNGGVDSAPTLCYLKTQEGSDGVYFSEGETVILEGNTFSTDTPESAEYPNYPYAKIFIYDVNTGGKIAFSPELFLTNEKLYAWTAPTTGVLSTSVSSHDLYQKNKIDLPNDLYISLGALPLYDTSSLRAYKDLIGFFANSTSSAWPSYRFADGSSELSWFSTESIGVDHDFSLNNSTSFSAVQNQKVFLPLTGSNAQILPTTEGNFNPSIQSATGVHEVESTRTSTFRNQAGSFFKKIFGTTISSGNAIDSVPPFIESIQLITNGLLQGSYDPNASTTIRIKVDPGLGIEYHNLSANTDGAYDIDFLPDSISSISLYKGSSSESLVDVPVVLVGEYYEAVITGGGTSDKEFFKVSAEDLAGNTLSYEFYVPVSASVLESDLNTEELTECIPGMYSHSFDPSVIILNPGQTIPFNVSLTNNSSIGCGLWTAGASIKKVGSWSVIINMPIKFSTSPALAATANSASASGFVEDVISGSTDTGTMYIKALDTAEPGTYPILFKITDSNIDLPEDLPIEYNLTVNVVAPGDEETTCIYSNPTISFVEVPENLSENGSEVPFSVMVTNNNSSMCPSETYTLNVNDNSSFIGVGSTPPLSGSTSFTGSVTGAGGQTVPIPLFLKAFPGSFVPDALLTATLTGSTPDISVTETMPVEILGVCEADFNNDNQVSIQDFLLLSSKVGSSNLSYDLTGDGLVNIDDTAYISTLMGTVCTN